MLDRRRQSETWRLQPGGDIAGSAEWPVSVGLVPLSPGIRLHRRKHGTKGAVQGVQTAWENGDKRAFWIRRRHPEGAIDIPVAVINGVEQGPVFSIIAGVHGAEYAPIVASQTLFRLIDPAKAMGQIRFVFIANLPSYRKRSVFVNPTDGKNLNRCFPGDCKGSHTGFLAHTIFSEVIDGSAYLVDLHSGDMIEDLEPFAIVKAPGDSEEDRARMRLAASFPVGHLLNLDTTSEGWSCAGTTFDSAQSAGVVSCMVEAGGKGQLDPASVEILTRGVLNALAWSGNLKAEPSTPARQQLMDRLLPVTSQTDGVFVASVKAGQTVCAGDALGVIYDYFGRPVDSPQSPVGGVVLLISSSPSVEEGSTLAGIGVPAMARTLPSL